MRMYILTANISLLSLVFLFANIPASYARWEGDYLNQVTTKLQTPHVSFAKPYANGPIKILFVIPRTVAREIIELYQRFDITYDAVTVFTSHQFTAMVESDETLEMQIKGITKDEKEKELIEKLRNNYDCIVMGNVDFDILPGKAQFEILDKVKNGTGLVLIYNHKSDIPMLNTPIKQECERIVQEIPFAGLPFFRQRSDLASTIKTFTFGKGRIALIDYETLIYTRFGGYSLSPPEEYYPGWEFIYKYYLSLVAKTILWSVPSKDAKIKIALNLDGKKFPRSSLPQEHEVGIDCHYKQAAKAECQLEIRDCMGNLEYRKTSSVSFNPGIGSISINLPVLKAGKHFLEISISSNKGVENWAASAIEITNDLMIQGIEFRKNYYTRKEKITGRIVFSQSLGPDHKTRVLIEDVNNRKFFDREFACAEGQKDMAFETSLSKATGRMVAVFAELKQKDQIISSFYKEIPIDEEQTGAFRVIAFGSPGHFFRIGDPGQKYIFGGMSLYVLKELRKLGVNTSLPRFTQGHEQQGMMLHAKADMGVIPTVYNVRTSLDKSENMPRDHQSPDIKDGSFDNPAIQKRAQELLSQRITPLAAFKPFSYNLGDENYYYCRKSGDPVFSAWDIIGFQQYLENKYKTIENLNVIWEKRYQSWKEIKGEALSEMVKQKKFPIANDILAFKENQFFRYHKYLSGIIKKLDHGAKIGNEGNNELPDVEQLAPQLDMYIPYPEAISPLRLLRAMNDDGIFWTAGWWGGYISGPRSMREHGAIPIWEWLIRGFIRADCLYSPGVAAEGFLSADMTPAPYFAKILPELDEIHHGIGQLVSECQLEKHGIVVYRSQTNEYASRRIHKIFGDSLEEQNTVFNLVDSIGLNTEYITDRMLQTDENLLEKCKLLFLPIVQAISDNEIKAIKKFVENGGVVVTDLGFGYMDQYCRPTEGKGTFINELFGIVREECPKIARSPLSGEMQIQNAEFVFSGHSVVDTSITPKGAQCIKNDKGNIFYVNHVGNGTAIYLNFRLSDFLKTVKGNPWCEKKNFIKKLLEISGLKTNHEVEGNQEDLIKVFRNHSMKIIGIVRPYPKKEQLSLCFDEPFYVYDMRKGREMGKIKNLILLPDSEPVKLFSLLPYPLLEIKLRTEKEEYSLGEDVLVSIDLKYEKTFPHKSIVDLQFSGPDNKEVTVYRRFLRTDTQTVSSVISLALNDLKGRWQIQAKDIATGKKTSHTFFVK